MTEEILVLNAGSSTLKFKVFGAATEDKPAVLSGSIDTGGEAAELTIEDASGIVLSDVPTAVSNDDAMDVLIRRLFDWLQRRFGNAPPRAVGHRIVHGGPDLQAPVKIDADIIKTLEACIPLAPLHLPGNLRPVGLVAELWPGVPQIGCFDTAFHRTHGDIADRFAIPERFYDEGVRRYGFHGLSYEYIARRLQSVAPDIARGRIVVAHLGSGASLCAIRDGRSIDSSMGFSALDGLPMGTRPGRLDPGAVLHLITAYGMSPTETERLLYRESGLKGLSGISGDVRVLASSDDPRARRALDYFSYHVAREIAGLIPALGGLDGLVFTAGIGEHAADIRRDICARLGWLGVSLDADANAAYETEISAHGTVPVLIVPTDEERMIAAHVQALLPADTLGVPIPQDAA